MVRPWQFEEIQHASWMMLPAFLPSAAVFFVYQYFVTDDTVALMCRIDRTGAAHDLTALFNYYISWVAHVMIGLGISYGAARNAFRNISADKIKTMKRFRFAGFILAMLLVFLADARSAKLAVLTHFRVFTVLSVEPSLAPLFDQEFLPWVSRPTWFSLFPISGVAVGLWATATMVLCASKFLSDFGPASDGATQNERIAKFTDALEALRSHFLALSLVLVTSTLGTIAFLRIPLGLLGTAGRHDFKAVSDSIGLIWGVMFSLTLLCLCVHPFVVLRARFNALESASQGAKNEILRRWVRKNQTLLHVPANLQVVLSVVSPATVAVLANLVSN